MIQLGISLHYTIKLAPKTLKEVKLVAKAVFTTPLTKKIKVKKDAIHFTPLRDNNRICVSYFFSLQIITEDNWHAFR